MNALIMPAPHMVPYTASGICSWLRCCGFPVVSYQEGNESEQVDGLIKIAISAEFEVGVQVGDYYVIPHLTHDPEGGEFAIWHGTSYALSQGDGAECFCMDIISMMEATS